MTISDNHKRPLTNDAVEASVTDLHSGMEMLLEKLNQLQTLSADSAEYLRSQLEESNARLNNLKGELSALQSEANGKREKEMTEVTIIHQEQFERDMESLLRENITIPDYKMRLYWDHLKFKIEPSSTGGVAVTMSFPHSSRLSDLRFVLQFASIGETFIVSDCDPMVIGLTDLVSSLNSDTRPGALARFCCRVRSTYTAQYSTDI